MTTDSLKKAVQKWCNSSDREALIMKYGTISKWDTSSITCMARLFSGEEDLKVATEKLADTLSEADPTIMEEDACQQIERNNNERNKLLLEWETFRKQYFEQIKAARGMVEHSSVNMEG